jgi:flagellar biosynthesis protein FlhG
VLDHGLDQAAGLRRLLARPATGLLAFPLADAQPAGWIAQLAHALHALGRRPVVVDAGGGAVAGCFGLRLRHDLLDLLQGTHAFDAVARCAGGVHVLRAERGLEAFVASGEPVRRLLEAFAALSHGFDDLLLAMPAGELASVAGPGATTPAIALPAGPDGLVGSYALVKRLAGEFGYRRFACVATGARDEAAARADHQRLAAAATRFLAADVAWAGWFARGPGGPPTGSAEALLTLTAAPRPA